MKRIIYIILIFLSVGLAVFLGWYFRYRTQTNNQQPTTNGAETGGITGGVFTAEPGTIGGGQTANGAAGQEKPTVPAKFGVVAQNPAADFYLDASSTAVIIEPGGKIVRLRQNKTEVLSETAIADLASAAFSYDGKKILVSFGDRDNPQTSIFDIDKKTWQALPADLKEAVWSPANYSVAYVRENAGQNIIYTLDVANAKAAPREIFRTFLQDLHLQWPYAKKMIFGSRSGAQAAGNLFELDMDKKTITPLLVNKTGLRATWNPDANQGLVFYDGLLGLLNRDKNTVSRFGFSSLPSKCAFNTQKETINTTSTIASAPAKQTKTATQTITNYFIFCAAPQNQEFIQSLLPDDYEKEIVFSADNFVKINTASGAAETIFSDPSQKLDAVNLRVFNNNLFFVNRLDQKLYAIGLESRK